MATNVTATDKVGKPFNFDASSFLNTRGSGNPISLDPIGEDSTIVDAKKRISSLLDGELPEEVLKQVEIRAAEKGQQTGLTGPAARNITFRDLGASAMDAISAGIQGAGSMEALRLDREKADRALKLDAERLNEEMRQANDRFSLALRDADRNDAMVALEGLKLQSANLQFRLSEENRLILSDTQTAIPNLQHNLDTLASSFDSFNAGYQKYIELFY
jgi:hypothetical protein